MCKNIQNNGVYFSGGLKHRHMSVNVGLVQIGKLLVEHQYGHIDGLLRDNKNSNIVERSLVQNEDLYGGEDLPKNNIPGFIDGTLSVRIEI